MLLATSQGMFFLLFPKSLLNLSKALASHGLDKYHEILSDNLRRKMQCKLNVNAVCQYIGRCVLVYRCMLLHCIPVRDNKFEYSHRDGKRW